MLALAGILLVPAAACVGVLRQWRACLLSLGLLYILLALMEGLAIGPRIAVSQLIVGLTTLAVVSLSARQIFAETQSYVIHGRLPGWEYLFESLVAAVAAVGAALFARAHPLFSLPGPVSFAWTWLGLAGLFMVVLASNIIEVGLGLLVFDAGLNLLILSTSAGEWWLSLIIVQVIPIALALLIAIAGIRLSHLGHGVSLDVLKEKAPFVMGHTGPVRIRVRRRNQALSGMQRAVEP